MTYLVIAALVIAYIAFARVRARQRLRVTATVSILPSGQSSVTFVPSGASEEDLARMCLNYGSKLRWVLLTEPEEIQQLFRDLTEEALLCWSEEAGPLLGRLKPISERIQADVGIAAAVPGGETYVIRYSRSAHQHVKNRSVIWNKLPIRRLNVNYAWHYVLLLAAVYDRLRGDVKEVAGQAYARWWQLAFEEWVTDRSLKGLSRLAPAGDEAWDEAWLGEPSRRELPRCLRPLS